MGVIKNISKVFPKQKLKTLGNAGASKTVNFDDAGNQAVTIDQATTITLSTTHDGEYSLFITNGGAYTITWATTIRWAGSAEPTWTTSGEDCLTLKKYGSTWYGVASLDFGTV